MSLRKWESWVVCRRAGVVENERRLRRHWTERAAKRWAESVTNQPVMVAASIDGLLRTGRAIFFDAEARRSDASDERSGREDRS